MIRFLLPPLMLLVSVHSFSQKKGYEWGYIINEKQDTIEGWIKNRDNGPFIDLYSKIRFKQEGKLFKKKYSSNDLLGYGYFDSHFVSLPLRIETTLFRTDYYLNAGASRTFLKVVKRSDCLNYYEKEFILDDNSYLDSYPLFHIPNTRTMVRVTQGILGLKKKRLSEYFEDCPSLVDAIQEKEITEVMEVHRFYCNRCPR